MLVRIAPYFHFYERKAHESRWIEYRDGTRCRGCAEVEHHPELLIVHAASKCGTATFAKGDSSFT
jgi:hypothetical protein